jgi:RNA polymerase sigma factor (sigma-70 family)
MSIRDRVRAAITLARQIGHRPLPDRPGEPDGPALVSWAQPLVDAVVRTVRELPGYDREDLVQDAFVGILQAARTFDPQRGRSFAEWAARGAIQQVLDRVRWSRRHEPELLADSLDCGEDEHDRPLRDRVEGLADPRQEPDAVVEQSPRRRLAWAIVAMAERAGGQAKAALDLLTRTGGDEAARAAAREALRPVVAAALAAVIQHNSFRRAAGRRVT